MGTIRHIATNGKITQREAARAPDLKDMQGFVGGYIELVPLPDGIDQHWLIVNDSGLVNGMKVNNKASRLHSAAYPNDPSFIHGNVIELIGIELD